MVQVDLITGFLGSGKTTFLRRYVQYLVAQNVVELVHVKDAARLNDDPVKAAHCH